MVVVVADNPVGRKSVSRVYSLGSYYYSREIASATVLCIPFI